MTKRINKQMKSTKAGKISALLSCSNGATIAEMARSTDWQPHSVRGFISDLLKKKLGFEVKSKIEDSRPRHYFIVRSA